MKPGKARHLYKMNIVPIRQAPAVKPNAKSRKKGGDK